MTHTPTPWHFRPEVIHPTDTGGYGTPVILKRAAVIIPEHFDAEADDNIDEIEVRLEANAKFIVLACNSHAALLNAAHLAVSTIQGTIDAHKDNGMDVTDVYAENLAIIQQAIKAAEGK